MPSFHPSASSSCPVLLSPSPLCAGEYITFAEFLPRVLGTATTRTWGLGLLDTGYYEEYRQAALNKHLFCNICFSIINTLQG